MLSCLIIITWNEIANWMLSFARLCIRCNHSLDVIICLIELFIRCNYYMSDWITHPMILKLIGLKKVLIRQQLQFRVRWRWTGIIKLDRKFKFKDKKFSENNIVPSFTKTEEKSWDRGEILGLEGQNVEVKGSDLANLGDKVGFEKRNFEERAFCPVSIRII